MSVKNEDIIRELELLDADVDLIKLVENGTLTKVGSWYRVNVNHPADLPEELVVKCSAMKIKDGALYLQFNLKPRK